LTDSYKRFVIGGEQFYYACINLCNRIYLTRIYHKFDNADVWFPNWQQSEFTLIEKEFHNADDMITVFKLFKEINKEMNILYIHGLNSTANSRTYEAIKKEMCGIADVYSIQLSNDLHLFKNFKSNVALVRNTIKSHKINLIIGSSMGGFAASTISGVAKILINPCLHPSIELPKVISITPGEINNYRNYENVLNVDQEDRLVTYGLFSTHDELFSYKKEFETRYLSNHAESMTDGHRISVSNVHAKLTPFIKRVIMETKQLNKFFVNFNPAMIHKDMNIEQAPRHAILNEAYINAFEKADMKKYADGIWKIIEFSYKDIGGTKMIAPDVDTLIAESDMWKMVRRNGKVVACMIYTFKRGGRKAICGGTDGSREGKIGLYDIMKEDIKLYDRNAWAEVSHAMEHIMYNKFGAVPIPNTMAAEIMSDKKFIEFDPDGLHYTRLIGGQPVRKMMVGRYKK
jgi:predicted esterase YcpF (UPF0227 family)